MKNSPNRINSIIAHDLKDPLSSISGIADILIGNWTDFKEEDKLEIIQEIRESSDSAMRLLNDLLDWSRKTTETFEPEKNEFKAEKIIFSVKELLRLQLNRKKVEVENHVPADLSVFGDENMFAAILRNLLANAAKSCVGGGKIDITAELSSSHSVFCIRDNGIGMTKSRIDQLFAGTKTSSGQVSQTYNNGFGLILCRDFITMNGGKLWAESQEGLGTKVFFTFPVKPNQ